MRRLAEEQQKLRNTLAASGRLVSPASTQKKTYAELLQALGDTTVACMFYLSDHYSGVFVVCDQLPSEPKRIAYEADDVGRIYDAVKLFHNSQHLDPAAFDDAVAKLSAALRMPEVHQLLSDNGTDPSAGTKYQAPNYSQLALVPFGVLQAVPLGALPVNDAGLTLADVYSAGTFTRQALQCCTRHASGRWPRYRLRSTSFACKTRRKISGGQTKKWASS
eukprot:m.475740 g.475740  ORF g.475740 m.475740 type:complete len:220 (-) comp20398_c0_seq15:4582-5241(-)